MNTVCQKDRCTGCMACLEVCTKNAISIKDDLCSYNAEIDEQKCIHCSACHKICQNNREIDFRSPICWFQGWANDEEVRADSSSGGFAAAIERRFVEQGGIVCSCTFNKGEFCFEFAENVNEISKFMGSKYVKSNPYGIYKKITQLLKNNRSVLFVGLPCQVAALKIFVPIKLQNNLYTIDLICHGTPSPKNLADFLKQYGYCIAELNAVSFRKNGVFRIEQNDKLIVPEGVYDRYSLAFLNSMNYTDNCYSCRYAKLDRVSDITVGDSWGSELPEEEKKKGISLALCQTDKGIELLNDSDIKLFKVDLETSINNNLQLKQPSIKPKKYSVFFDLLQKGVNYNIAVARVLPRTCMNQEIKKILVKFKLI